MPKAVDYNTVPPEELVKIATELRDERDAVVKERDTLRDERDALVEERDKLRRAMRNDMRRFCEHCVPDFTPLGGNRPDCAVATCATVSLSAASFVNRALGTENPLPPDVLACAAGILCAPVIIDGSLDYKEAVELCKRKGPARTLSVRLRLKSEEELEKYCGDSFGQDSDDGYDEDFDLEIELPWEKYNDNESVTLKVELSPDIKTLPQDFLKDSPSVKSIDLRSTQLTSLANFSLDGMPSLSEVQLPTTLVTIGSHFPNENIQSLDLRHLPNLKTIGDWFMRDYASLTELHLPPSVETIDNSFLRHCTSIKSIDLSSTSISTISGCFGNSCRSLTDIKLPPSITAIEHCFLNNCVKIKSIDLRHLTGLTSLGRDFMSGCDSLTEVYLPDSVGPLPETFLQGCKLNPVCHLVGVKRSRSDE